MGYHIAAPQRASCELGLANGATITQPGSYPLTDEAVARSAGQNHHGR